MSEHRLPPALEYVPQITEWAAGRRLAFFLDLDGTLAPFAPRPELVHLSARVRDALVRAARRHLVCVVSGRSLADLKDKVCIDTIYYAADHGHRIAGPPASGIDVEIEGAKEGTMLAAATELERRLQHVAGVVIEVKEVTLSVHYRLVAEEERPLVRRAVADAARAFPDLRPTEGKLVCELRPAGTWNKGRAILWLLERLGRGKSDTYPICLGDDVTDEDMFRAVADWGIPVIVGDPARPTRARYRLGDGDEVAAFLEWLGSC
ncbi:MAG: trehalose-phosphatase [Acidobacteria bacterium RBG_16_64_8]|nr:MAG: trehalose-phosphatase [Acidobacteria bacterium RBG_16_64_8]